ncbi:MAG TPA: FAD-dependent oxidoreductase [Pseudomonadales bacterium]|nr:FAD-dependent oxidoreductase [Pseudomonadales bacterium]
MTAEPVVLNVDIAIIGGGIAGLWMLHRAVNAGYNAVLFESHALGSGQTVASQGMIHGGVKYTLGGALSGASEAIADMPAHWRHCMTGEGDVDLRGTTLLSDHFYMWSSRSAVSKVTTFLASKALRGRVHALKKPDYPAAFRHPAFKGSLYKLVDRVIDTPSLLETLRKPHQHRIFAIDQQAMTVQKNAGGATIVIRKKHGLVHIDSQLCVFSAGKGNGALLQQLAVKSPAMQLRPLHQVMVRKKNLPALYAHCVGTDSKPRLTISSHVIAPHVTSIHAGEADTVWYLGGQLAEEGVDLSPDALIQRAKKELGELFSWIDWQDAAWATLRVDRAEPAQPGLLRPDNAWLSACDDLVRCVVAWPTKLTLVPNLGNLLMDYLGKQQIKPRFGDSPEHVLPLMTAIAPAPWQSAMFTGGDDVLSTTR